MVNKEINDGINQGADYSLSAEASTELQEQLNNSVEPLFGSTELDENESLTLPQHFLNRYVNLLKGLILI